MKSAQLETTWRNFAKGLNTLVASNKIGRNELSVATNVILEGEGFPTKRPGLDYFGDALTSGEPILNQYAYYNEITQTSQLLALQGGFLKRQNTNGSWAMVTGASFASGQLTCGVMTSNYLYLSNGVDNLARYDGSYLTVFNAISAPASTFLTLGGSLASGQYIYSYRVSAFNSIGETLAAGAATIALNTPRDIWNVNPDSLINGRSITVNWTKVSSSKGYNIYGYINGSETLIDSVEGENVTSYMDYGIRTPSNFFEVPSANTTTGPKGKFIIDFKGSLIIGGDPSNPSRLYYSAGADKPDSFAIADGGGWIDVSKNSDDGSLTGAQAFQDSAIIFKERSTWRFDFTTDVIPSLSSLKRDLGAISHYSIVPVENELFFTGRKVGSGPAIYVLGNEPNYLSQLRTNELSARVRSYLESLTPANFEKVNAVYSNGRYMFFYTNGGDIKNNAAIVYDRERGGFTYWNNIYSDSSLVYYEADGTEHILLADNNDYSISELSDAFTDDKGSPITWMYRTADTDFNDPYGTKRFDEYTMRLKDVNGNVHFKLWGDTNNLLLDQSIDLTTGNVDTVFGSAQFGDYQFGTTEVASSTNLTTNVIIRRLLVRRLGRYAWNNSIALEVYGDELASNATLTDLRLSGTPRSRNFYSRNEEIF